MFTGIVLDVGQIARLEPHNKDLRADIQTQELDLTGLSAGDSIAVNGVCLTAITLSKNQFTVDISGETLSCTSLGGLKVGSRVNLETALTPDRALGGHMVSGHVDGLAKVIALEDEGRSVRYQIEAPAELARYIAPKGSVTLDGVSLTVNQVEGNQFDINIIPHTMEKTVFADYQIGSTINIEVDIIARYLERLLSDRASSS